jgi:hypothetical protein
MTETAVGALALRGTRLVVQSLCGLGFVGRGPLSSELGGGELTMGAVGPFGVVVAAPVLDDHSCFQLVAGSSPTYPTKKQFKRHLPEAEPDVG